MISAGITRQLSSAVAVAAAAAQLSVVSALQPAAGGAVTLAQLRPDPPMRR